MVRPNGEEGDKVSSENVTFSFYFLIWHQGGTIYSGTNLTKAIGWLLVKGDFTQHTSWNIACGSSGKPHGRILGMWLLSTVEPPCSPSHTIVCWFYQNNQTSLILQV